MADEQLLGKRFNSPLLAAVQSHHAEYPEEMESTQLIVENLLQLRKHFYMLRDDDLDESTCRGWKLHLEQVASQFQQRADMLNQMEAELSTDLAKIQQGLKIGKHNVGDLMELPAELAGARCHDGTFLERCIATFTE